MSSLPTVDVHSHFMAHDLPDFATDHGDERWPRLVVRSDRHGVILRGGTPFRRVALQCWDVQSRSFDLHAAGVERQVLSPVPIGLTYWADPKPALRFAQHQNDRLAEAAAQSGAFEALGTVPLQAVDLAVGELERIVGELGLSGVEIGTVVGNRELSHDSLNAFFEAAQELGAAIFVHPIEGASIDRCDDPIRAFGIGMMTDTALAADALVFGGVLARFPDLRICLSHGGGTFAWCFPRLLYARSVGRSSDEASEIAAASRTNASRLWVDSIVFDAEHLDVAAAMFGRSRILFGSDYPFMPLDSGVAVGDLTDGATAASDFLFGAPREEPS